MKCPECSRPLRTNEEDREEGEYECACGGLFFLKIEHLVSGRVETWKPAKDWNPDEDG